MTCYRVVAAIVVCWMMGPVWADGPQSPPGPAPPNSRSIVPGTPFQGSAIPPVPSQYSPTPMTGGYWTTGAGPGAGAGGFWAPGGYEPRYGSPNLYHDPQGGHFVVTGDPYYDHWGPGYHRHDLYGHFRFPYYSYRAPWYYPGRAVYNRDTNFPW